MNPIKIILLFFAILQINADTCYGNCPSNTCEYCYCGVFPSKYDTSLYCAKSSWDQNCCKCIIGLSSQGNQNFLFYVSPNYYVEELAIRDNDTLLCRSTRSQMCEAVPNQQCAFKIFSLTGNWDYWYNWARGCGCPVSSSQKEA